MANIKPIVGYKKAYEPAYPEEDKRFIITFYFKNAEPITIGYSPEKFSAISHMLEFDTCYLDFDSGAIYTDPENSENNPQNPPYNS